MQQNYYRRKKSALARSFFLKFFYFYNTAGRYLNEIIENIDRKYENIEKNAVGSAMKFPTKSITWLLVLMDDPPVWELKQLQLFSKISDTI